MRITSFETIPTDGYRQKNGGGGLGIRCVRGEDETIRTPTLGCTQSRFSREDTTMHTELFYSPRY